MRYDLWEMIGWHRDYDPCDWRSRGGEERKRGGWKMWVRIERSIAALLHEVYRLQVEAMYAFERGLKGFYRSSLG